MIHSGISHFCLYNIHIIPFTRCNFFYLFFQAGVDIKEVQEMVENHLKDMLLKHFDPKKADSIFTDEVCKPEYTIRETLDISGYVQSVGRKVVFLTVELMESY